MQAIRRLRNATAFAVLMVAVALLTGCGGKKNVWGDPESGLILEYRMEPGDVLKYEISSEGEEITQVMGQSYESGTSKTLVFSLEAKGVEDGNHRLGITIESLEAGMVTAQGQFSADTEELPGQKFDMILSVLGEEMDLGEAESIEYGIGPMGSRSIKPDFQEVFPDLPTKPVKVGDSWVTTDEVGADQGNVTIVISTESVNTLAGYETMNGLKCAKITAGVTGTVTGEGEQMGAPLTLEGTLKGTETWYFAYEKGYPVEINSEVDSDIIATVQAGQKMEIPVKGKTTITTKLIE